ncbi:MAG: chromate efflux transporter [bacterium]
MSERAGEKPFAGGSFFEILGIFLKLGFTSFGGPTAHLGYFREEFVVRRKWLDERAYADLVALCQFLPGPASSQVGMALGIVGRGIRGGLAAWLGFTLPSALLLTLFAFGFDTLQDMFGRGWLDGLKIVAVAVVARAVWGMAQSLCPDRPRATIAILSAMGVLAWPAAGAQVVAILAGGVIGWRLLKSEAGPPASGLGHSIGRRLSISCLILFFGILIFLPLAVRIHPSQALALFDSFFRTGSLVFGGGHVVLPLLQAEVIRTGWITDELFLAGYGAAQAIPGPLFTFSAYLGASMSLPPNGWAGAALSLVAVFLPSGLLIVGVLPFWDDLRSKPAVRCALQGVNAAVVGLLLAALYHPVWTGAVHTPANFILALAAFGLLALWKLPPWLVVLMVALVSGLM